MIIKRIKITPLFEILQAKGFDITRMDFFNSIQVISSGYRITFPGIFSFGVIYHDAENSVVEPSLTQKVLPPSYIIDWALIYIIE